MPSEQALQERVQAVENWLIAHIPALWGLPARIGSEERTQWENGSRRSMVHYRYDRDQAPRLSFRKPDEDPEWPLLVATMAGLEAEFGSDGERLAEYLFNPALRRFPVPRLNSGPDREAYQAQCACLVGLRCVAKALAARREPAILRSALQRARYLLRDSHAAPECTDSWRGPSTHAPQLTDLRVWLDLEFPIVDYAEDCRALLRGDWNAHYQRDQEERSSYGEQLYLLHKLVLASMVHFRARDQWSYDDFCQLVRLSPSIFSNDLLGVIDGENFAKGYLGADWLIEDTRRLAWETLCAATSRQPDSDEAGFLHALAAEAEGARWLLQCARLIEAHGLGPKQVNEDNYDDLSRSLIQFSQLEALAADDDPDRVVEQLREFQAETLWLLLPFSGAAQPLLFRALRVENLLPLHGWIERMRSRVYNSESTNSGRVDCEEVEGLLAGIAEKTLQRYLKAVRDSRVDSDETTKVITLLDALRGKNRDKIEKALAKHGQIAAKAYGLLPVRDADDARERYRRLKQVWKECTRYGAERQANTRAAVTVGLANLAQRAGYRDAARMEWDMEAAIGGEAAARLQPAHIGDWDVCVRIEGIKPVLAVSKAGKSLKSIPAGIRKLPDFIAMKQAVDELKEQATRFRRALEQLMCDGEVLPLADLRKLVQIPAVAFLLGNLVGLDEAGHLGMIDPAALVLVDGEQRWPIEGALKLAHGLDLLAAEALPHWQQHIVQAQIVQPFKQVFRELYVPTPAELESGDHSRRFCGHCVNGATAYRLLQGRSWSSYESTASKRFPEATCRVDWEFPDVRHYLAEDEAVTADEIHFHRGGQRLPIAEVPPLAFSEAMRDADLVVSVAGIAEDGAYWSAEVSRHRRELLQELAQMLGLQKKLRFEDNFVLFSGKLASYRIHLGSGVIHIMPGSYLCIVPAPDTKTTGKLYLPFADTDRKTSEIMSKLLLLLNDHKIKDESILAQTQSRDAG
ncbi:MAG: DUF4132 domain-containing protein [Xanthomonadales bacterium]|nr:DUF4132 domain-containing protein [Xanthomonadales bacterium]